MHPYNFTSVTLSFARVYKYLQFNKVFSWYKCCKKYFLKVVFISLKKVVAVPRFRQCSYGPPLQSAPPALAANWLLIGTKLICGRPLKNSSFFQKSICPQPLLLPMLVGVSRWSWLPITYYRLATTNIYIIIVVLAIIDLNYVS